MKSPTIFVIAALLSATASAFQVAPPSSFTGRAASIYNNKRQQSSRMKMGIVPPFLKKLGRKSLQDDDDDSNNVLAVLEQETSSSDDNAVVATNDTKEYLETVKSVEVETNNGASTTNNNSDEEQTETQKLMQQVKDAGLAGIISYALWEWAFWLVSVPVCVFGYYEVTGHMPDFGNAEDMQKLGAEAFAFVNFARFAVPLRIGLALSTTPWIEENIVEVYFKKHAKDNGEGESANAEGANGSSE